jgi:hypothetical protein
MLAAYFAATEGKERVIELSKAATLLVKHGCAMIPQISADCGGDTIGDVEDEWRERILASSKFRFLGKGLGGLAGVYAHALARQLKEGTALILARSAFGEWPEVTGADNLPADELDAEGLALLQEAGVSTPSDNLRVAVASLLATWRAINKTDADTKVLQTACDTHIDMLVAHAEKRARKAVKRARKAV